jgi:hypothetical protein
VQYGDRDEGEHRDPGGGRCLQRATSDAQQRLEHESDDRSLEAKEHAFHEWMLVPEYLRDREREDGDEAGQDEQRARDEAATRAVQQQPM